MNLPWWSVLIFIFFVMLLLVFLIKFGIAVKSVDMLIVKFIKINQQFYENQNTIINNFNILSNKINSTVTGGDQNMSEIRNELRTVNKVIQKNIADADEIKKLIVKESSSLRKSIYFNKEIARNQLKSNIKK